MYPKQSDHRNAKVCSFNTLKVRLCVQWQLYGHFFQTPKSVHRTATVCSVLTGFPQLWKVAIKLTLLPFCIMQNTQGETKVRNVAVKPPRLAVE